MYVLTVVSTLTKLRHPHTIVNTFVPLRSSTVGRRLDVDKLVGAQEIADLLGVTRQVVHQWRTLPDFPAPSTQLSMGMLWYWPDVEAWAKRTGRVLPDGTL